MVDKSEFPFWFSQSNGTNPLPQIGSEVQWNGTTNVMKFVQSWNVAHRATQQQGITQFFTIMANIHPHPSQHLWCIWILAREAALKLVRRQAVDWEGHGWYFDNHIGMLSPSHHFAPPYQYMFFIERLLQAPIKTQWGKSDHSTHITTSKWSTFLSRLVPRFAS